MKYYLTVGRWCLFIKNMYVRTLAFPPSKAIISLQNHFLKFIFWNETDASESYKTSDFTGYKYFFVFK